MSSASPLKPHSTPGLDTARRNYALLLARMQRLMEITRTLASTLDLDKLLRKIIEAANEVTGTEAASIMLIDPMTGELRFEAATNLRSSELKGIVIPLEGSIAGWIVRHSEPLVVPDTRQDPRWHQSVDETTSFITSSILGVPLLARDKTIGVLEAINKRQGAFSEDDVTLLQSLAAQAAVAIVNARLFQQSDLISEMVHELRTPLNALMATSHLLVRPELPEGRHRELVTTLQRETARLSQMTTDFLDMARLESGRIRFTSERFDLGELVRECVEVVRHQAEAHGIGMDTRIMPWLPALETDRSKLKQVILNLLTNGVKYNRDRGQITAAVEVASRQFRVSVTDTGKGIPAEAMPHVFEKFYRVPDSEGYASGTGLGLAVAKKIVEVLGGEIGVNSTVNVGSTFYITLPLIPKKTGPLGS